MTSKKDIETVVLSIQKKPSRSFWPLSSLAKGKLEDTLPPERAVLWSNIVVVERPADVMITLSIVFNFPVVWKLAARNSSILAFSLAGFTASSHDRSSVDLDEWCDSSFSP